MARIVLDKVSVHYPLAEIRRLGLKDTVTELAMGGRIGGGLGGLGVGALSNVSFELNDGDRIGLIGSNGAGKTTLLKVLGTILPPSKGRIEVQGRVSALLSIHLGMDADATGNENILYRARHMGLSEREIAARFDEIADFSELGEYLAMPMRTYSSGMKLRLAFAIATAFAPDVLVLDEWLSAGDAAFQKKAGQRLTELIERSGVFAFASHSTKLLERYCNKGLVLEHGQVAFYGPMAEALAYRSESTDT